MNISRAVAALAVATAVGGLGTGAAASAPAEGPTKTSVRLQTESGPTRRAFTMRQPAGVVLLTRLTTTSGIRARAAATIPGLAGVAVTNDVDGGDVSARCRRRASLEVCTQDQEWCPMPRAVWRVNIVKTGGPAGLIRFDFVVGPPPRR